MDTANDPETGAGRIAWSAGFAERSLRLVAVNIRKASGDCAEVAVAYGLQVLDEGGWAVDVEVEA